MTRFVKMQSILQINPVMSFHSCIWTHLNCSSPHLSQPTPQWPHLWMPHSGYGQDFCSEAAQNRGRWGWEQHFKREALKFLRALETGQRITCHKDVCVSTELFVLVPGWLQVPRGGLAWPGPLWDHISVDWAGVHPEVELMSPCVRRHFREPDAGKRETSTGFFTAPPQERGVGGQASHAGWTLESTRFKYTSYVHYHTHLWFVESTQRLFPHFLLRHARWNCNKGIRGSRLSLPYDLPAPVKVTSTVWSLTLPYYWCSVDFSDPTSHSERLMNAIFKCVSALAQVIWTHTLGAIVRGRTWFGSHLVSSNTRFMEHILASNQDKKILQALGVCLLPSASIQILIICLRWPDLPPVYWRIVWNTLGRESVLTLTKASKTQELLEIGATIWNGDAVRKNSMGRRTCLSPVLMLSQPLQTGSLPQTRGHRQSNTSSFFLFYNVLKLSTDQSRDRSSSLNHREGLFGLLFGTKWPTRSQLHGSF